RVRELALLRVLHLHVPGGLSGRDRRGRAVAEADDGDRAARVRRVGDRDVVLRAGGTGVRAVHRVGLLVDLTGLVVEAHTERAEDRVEGLLQRRECTVDLVADRRRETRD